MGLVWLHCRYPILARGLSESLREEASVYHGEEPPEGAKPSSILFCAAMAEEISNRISQLQEAVPDAPVLVFGLSNGVTFARAALQAGARGFVHISMPTEQVVRALSVVSMGEVAVQRELLKELVVGRPPVDLDLLTFRQREVLKLVVEGQTNAQIGQKLFLSESTIKQHLRAAYKMLNVRNRTEAARLLRNEKL